MLKDVRKTYHELFGLSNRTAYVFGVKITALTGHNLFLSIIFMHLSIQQVLSQEIDVVQIIIEFKRSVISLVLIGAIVVSSASAINKVSTNLIKIKFLCTCTAKRMVIENGMEL